ncbi:hypothetical protein FRC11_001384, partial [Ceratobasidium sp. 423]
MNYEGGEGILSQEQINELARQGFYPAEQHKQVRDTVVLKNSLLREFELITKSRKRKTRDFDLEGEEGVSIQAEEMEMEGVDAECSSTDHDQAYIMTEAATSAIGSSKNVFSLLVNHLLEEVK